MSELVARIGDRRLGGALYMLLFPVTTVCFVGALATDIAYWDQVFLMWIHFSEWLIAVGLAVGALAGLVLLIDVLSHRATRSRALAWVHVALFFATLAVELCNAFVHTADGWTAVVPAGMTLSLVGAVLALLAAWTLSTWRRVIVRSVP